MATDRKTVVDRRNQQMIGAARPPCGRAWLLLLALWLVDPAMASDGNRLFADLQQALRAEASEPLIRLLDQGLDPNATDEQGTPLLVWAAARGDVVLVDALLRHGASPNRRNLVGETALMVAAFRGQLPVVERLLQAGAIADHNGWNPLLYAAIAGHAPVVEQLLRAKVNPNRAAANGMTALMWAAKNGHLATVAKLLAAGADTEAVNEEGKSALLLALEQGHTEVAQRIEAERQRRGLPPARIAVGIE